MPNLIHYLLLMAIGYLFTITIETTVLMVGLSRHHPRGRRLFCGFWLTACTYPVVWLVLPFLLNRHWLYLLVAETFAPGVECLIFYWFYCKIAPVTRRDYVAIVVANLCSFGLGELAYYYGLEDVLLAWVQGLVK